MSNHFEPWQCRAARGALDWPVSKLEEESGVSAETLIQFEEGKRNMQAAKVAQVLAAFDRAGVYFDGAGCVCRRAAPATIPVEELNAENDE